jgi:hypothetical protein
MIRETGGVVYQQSSNVVIVSHQDVALPANSLLSDEKIILKLPVVAFYVDRLYRMTLDSYKRPPNLQSTKATTDNIKISPIQIRADSQV